MRAGTIIVTGLMTVGVVRRMPFIHCLSESRMREICMSGWVVGDGRAVGPAGKFDPDARKRLSGTQVAVLGNPRALW